MRIRSALLVLLPLLSSCSIALSKGPPTGWRNAEAPDALAFDSCDPTPTWGFVDVAFSLMSMGAGYIASSGRLGPDEDRGEYILVGGIVGGLFGVGASVGFKRADDCEDFHGGFPGIVLGDGPEPVASGERTGDRPPDPNLITADQLAVEVNRSVMAAVQRLRPQWLARSGMGGEPPSVVMDDQEFELDILQDILPENVEWLRFVPPSDATTRWGTGYTSGAIEVRTRR